MSLAGCQARAGLPRAAGHAVAVHVEQVGKGHSAGASTSTASGAALDAVSATLPLIAACSRFSTQAAVFASRTAPSWWQHALVYCASTNAALTRALPFELRSSALLPVG